MTTYIDRFTSIRRTAAATFATEEEALAFACKVGLYQRSQILTHHVPPHAGIHASKCESNQRCAWSDIDLRVGRAQRVLVLEAEVYTMVGRMWRHVASSAPRPIGWHGTKLKWRYMDA
jgi:hypothetical protein